MEAELTRSTSTRSAVRLYVDPVCPFAWITSRWLREVTGVRPVDAELRLMSLSVLNEHRELEDWYRAFNDRAWGPARVAAVVQRDHPQAFSAFYDAFGQRRHPGAQRDDAALLAAALAEAGLPAQLADAAADTTLDPLLRAANAEVEALVGEESGTPVVVVDGAAFFGPVSTAILRGEDAGRVFDAVRTLAAHPDVTELKRARTRALSFA